MTHECDKTLLSADQAAKRLGLSEEWVRKAARLRQIESVKIGTRLLFRPESLDAYVDAHTREPVG